ncbi:hypothetical protein MNBD_GAMMA19-1296 [hydrothermal vent metagenome]|uniref:Uncharacterized protein n=1 Tax=hydrothermal vent metagenome TaxID=652676 RepID=A0A3B0ZTA2_9ZZZZ
MHSANLSEFQQAADETRAHDIGSCNPLFYHPYIQIELLRVRPVGYEIYLNPKRYGYSCTVKYSN